MALSSLRFRGHDSVDIEENRAGMPCYDGSAATFHCWELRVLMKMQSAEGGKEARVIAQIVDALRGEAMDVAMGVGVAKLMQKD